LCFWNGIVETEELFNASDAHGMADALTDAYERQRPSVLIVVDVGAHKGTDAGRIHVGHTGEIDDQRPVFAGAQGRLKMEESAENDRALEFEDALAGLIAVEVFDIERFLRGQRHREMLAFRADPIY